MPDTPSEKLPHDVREIIPYAWAWIDSMKWVIIALLIIGAIALILWAIMRYQKRQGSKLQETPKTLLERLSEINERIKRLPIETPFHERAQKEYFHMLSLMFREFIEVRYKFPATDQTLKELKWPIKQRVGLSADDINDVFKFLERSDFVKFAGEQLSDSEAEKEGEKWREKILGWNRQLMPRDIVAETTNDQETSV